MIIHRHWSVIEDVVAVRVRVGTHGKPHILFLVDADIGIDNDDDFALSKVPQTPEGI